jgi:probable phosphoglycerate mutase
VTLFCLVRHASHARQEDGTLVGRTPGIGLGPGAAAEIAWLRRRLAGTSFDAKLSGPLTRAVETARAIAGMPTIARELDEVDYGAWTGRRIDELALDPIWRNWNSFRSGTRVPGGETMLEAQARAVGRVEAARAAFPHGRVLLVSHAEILRALLLHFLGLPLDAFARITVDPGSLSLLTVEDWGASLVRLNESSATL